MKKIFIPILILAVAVLIGSCRNFLEFDLTNEIVDENAITTARDLQAAMNGVYDRAQAGSALGGNSTAFGDLTAADAFVLEFNLGFFGTFEIFNFATTVQIGLLRDKWTQCYSAINTANNVIDAIESNRIDDPALTPALRNRVLGEAYLMRAILHYDLLTFWSLPYDVATPGANSQAGVIYRTTPTRGAEGLAAPRNTVEECFNLVIQDLTTAENLLQPFAANALRFRANGDAATAMLARVYFQKGDYTNAALKSNQIIATARYTLEDSIINAFNRSGANGSSEHIFYLINIPTDQSNSLVGFYAQGSNPVLRADTSVFNLYEVNDSRRNQLYTGSDPAFRFIRKYEQIGANPLNVVLIRLAEMHLIRAEANIIANTNITQAVESYNAIRRRAIPGHVDVATATLEEVQLERRKEMAYELSDRFQQVRRLKLNFRRNEPWNSRRVLFKIPQEEIAGNPTIEQN